MSTNNRTREKDKDRENELSEKLVSVRRVAKVIKGGRRFSFAALVVVGDNKGRVGYATGKAREVPDAVRKAAEQARKSMVRVPLKEGRTLHHDVKGSMGAASVIMRSAPAGTGIIAGGPVRAILEAVGVHDVVSKSTGSSNAINMVMATMNALNSSLSPRQVAQRRGKKISEIMSRRGVESGN